MGNFKEMVRDLNGNGEDELIITRELGLGGSWSPLMGMPAWPAVYRLENGRYVEDSRDFPNYYDTKVLPQLDREIREAEARITEEPFQAETVAVAELTRDKILRVLGRNPVGGLNEAYQWMNSDNPTLMQCAIAAFGDIGGHEKEVCTLQQALPAAITHEIQSRNPGYPSSRLPPARSAALRFAPPAPTLLTTTVRGEDAPADVVKITAGSNRNEGATASGGGFLSLAALSSPTPEAGSPLPTAPEEEPACPQRLLLSVTFLATSYSSPYTRAAVSCTIFRFCSSGMLAKVFSTNS